MTAETLHARSAKDLAQLAKKRGVPGWHSMRKEQLVKALLRLGRAKSNGAKLAVAVPSRRQVASVNGRAAATARRSAPNAGKPAAVVKATAVKPPLAKANGVHSNLAGKTVKSSPPLVAASPAVDASRGPRRAAAPPAANVPPKPHVVRRLRQARAKLEQVRNLAALCPPDRPEGFSRDRLVVMVRDPFWLHAYWELTRAGVERARAALCQEWHVARPVLRVFEVSAGLTTNAAEKVVRDIEIHGGVNNWYIDVKNPPQSYRVDVGYLAPSGRFFCLARSNVVSTPQPGAADSIDQNWATVAEDFERIYARSGGNAPEGASLELQELFEERLRRPMGSPLVTRFGAGVEGLVPHREDFSFEVDAELIVYGSTSPDAHVTLQGDPVRLRPDGTFTVRFSMPNARQVIPAVACSADGLEQRTIVLAVERNTKTMEPLLRDAGE